MSEPEVNEMIDRVAKSLYARRNPQLGDWDLRPPGWKNEYRDLARVAITAMREPTDEILDSGSGASNTYPAMPPGFEKEPVHRFVVTQMWRAMIDAALR